MRMLFVALVDQLFFRFRIYLVANQNHDVAFKTNISLTGFKKNYRIAVIGGVTCRRADDEVFFQITIFQMA